MGDIIWTIIHGSFVSFIKFGAMLFIASFFATYLPKEKNKFWRILKGIGYAIIISAFISFPRPSEDDYYDDRPPKTAKEQMNDFYSNLGSCLVIIFWGSKYFVYSVNDYRKRKDEDDLSHRI